MYIKRNERGYGFLDFESGSHGHITSRIWIHNELITSNADGEFIKFPVNNAHIHKTQKGGLVLKKSASGCIYEVRIESGFRGSANIDKIEAEQGNIEIMAEGQQYHSGQGALGETAWAIVNVSENSPITVLGKCTGRRIDNEDVTFRLMPDGTHENMIADCDICKLMDD